MKKIKESSIIKAFGSAINHPTNRKAIETITKRLKQAKLAKQSKPYNVLKVRHPKTGELHMYKVKKNDPYQNLYQ